MRYLLILLFCALLSMGTRAAEDEPSESKSRASAYGAFSKGEAMSWDQLQVVAQDAGISGNQLLQLKVKDRFVRLIARLKLPLEVTGFSSNMPKDEEFRIVKGSKVGVSGLELNSDYWAKLDPAHDDDAYVTYLLLRADAFAQYRNHYDPEHCTWIVREESEPLSASFKVLRTTLNDSAADEEGRTPPTERELEFRKTLEPSGDPAKTVRKLIEYALRCIAQSAADNVALVRFRQSGLTPPPDILARINARQRVLASDFGRARFAMTLSERIVFHRILKTPFRYVAQARPKSQPSGDVQTSEPQ